MKVLQVVPELNAGGVERTTLEMAEALSRNGFTPHVVSAGGRMEAELAETGAVLHKMEIGSKNPFLLRRNTKALIDIIKSENIDLVHARSRAPAWPAHAAAMATTRPFVTTYHGIYNAKSGLKRRYNAIMTKGDIIIANSEFTKTHIIKEHGTDPAKIVVIPRGVDMSVFDPALIQNKNVKLLREQWGIEARDKVVLLPGRLTSWKGQWLAILAMAPLPKNYKLVLLGDSQGRDDYVNELWEIAEQHDMEHRLTIPGHTQDVATALAAADVVIAPSTDPEAFGRVVAEAQAMGRPVIASAHGGPLETIIEGQTGFLFPSGNEKALSEAIRKSLDWDNYTPDHARAHIANNYSKTRLQEKTLKVYRDLLM